ncbi:GNAT family N-acetyltransferase [uncultured Microbacterium sp.]|uniref:GCN5-related N-acetyltransferase n=1 Tax=uncultured Microbacterium sp. TaxID=191216 RepID=A0A1Y5PFW8_9MICO|nr:GNAT family N-acetyltransferase [uncultured Microbacterium sp.]SBS74808.1 GCN5-related N-acetyltransferase [uncultured Microbacterium sp.]
MAEITIVPASPDRFADVEQALTGGGDGASCWCQWWMLSASQFNATTRDERHDMLRTQAEGPLAPGLIGYVDGEPAGWVKVAPRTSQPRLARTRAFAASPTPFEDETAWAVSCFVVRREHRGQGLSAALLEAALGHARANGARVIEAYPLDTAVQKATTNDLYHGSLSTFLAAGFREVARPKPNRPIVSLSLAER